MVRFEYQITRSLAAECILVGFAIRCVLLWPFSSLEHLEGVVDDANERRVLLLFFLRVCTLAQRGLLLRAVETARQRAAGSLRRLLLTLARLLFLLISALLHFRGIVVV